MIMTYFFPIESLNINLRILCPNWQFYKGFMAPCLWWSWPRGIMFSGWLSVCSSICPIVQVVCVQSLRNGLIEILKIWHAFSWTWVDKMHFDYRFEMSGSIWLHVSTMLANADRPRRNSLKFQINVHLDPRKNFLITLCQTLWGNYKLDQFKLSTAIF